MNLLENRQDQISLAHSGKLALLLIVSLLLWFIGAPSLFSRVNAANLTLVSDTLTQSGPSQLSGHSIQFTATSAIAPSGTITVSLDPLNPLGGALGSGGSAFTEAFSTATSTDVTFYAGSTPYTVVTGASGCTSGNQVQAVGSYNGGSNENLAFTLCAGAAQINAATVVTIGVATSSSATKLWTNPPTTGSYRIDVTTPSDAGETQVAIVNNVTLTASVNTTFTFTVSGLATSTVVGDDTTTGSTTATALPFGVLSSSPTASSSLAQRLNVSTNATNGFSVTVQENQPPTSATGQIIYLFNNGATTSSPILWQSPSSTIGQYNTYGHFGVSSTDDEGGNEFGGGTQFVGNIVTPRVIFTNSGPADGVTNNVGSSTVLYKIQIGPLQAAGDDYTNTLWYVATPTF